MNFASQPCPGVRIINPTLVKFTLNSKTSDVVTNRDTKILCLLNNKICAAKYEHGVMSIKLRFSRVIFCFRACYDDRILERIL